MIVIPGNNIVFFDVDDTLILWSPTQEQLEKYGIDITCDKSMIPNWKSEPVPSGVWITRIVPHNVHIEELKKYKMRNHTVVVWSAGGYNWAKIAVKALKLEDYVDLVISKPTWIYDDLSAAEFMPKNRWLKNE